MLTPFPFDSSPGIFGPRKSEFVSLCTEDYLKGWNHFSDPWCGITFPTPGVGNTFPSLVWNHFSDPWGWKHFSVPGTETVSK